MSKTVKTWLTVATLLVVAGLTSLTVIMTVNGWDFSRLATERYETNTYESDDQITDISIKTDTADIVFIPSDNGKYKVTCYETEKVKHYVSVSEGMLTVTVV
ncbi:MAG: hypothetical protein IKB34_04985, partial [Clostridia bacterium]|nr:hypothetical protein [Clostridia bacterium]